jgi:xylulokinase
MEGVIFSLRDGLTIMEDLGLPISEVRAIGGGARSAMWCQMQADIFGRSIVRMRAEEGPAFGAAILAGVGVGLYRDVQAAVSATVGTREMIAPKAETSRTYADLYAIYRQLYSSLRSTFSALARV